MKIRATPRLLETDIKALLITKLLACAEIQVGDTIVNEFTIDNFSRRTDLLILKGGRTHAFEIKSEADSLGRLDGQVEKYLAYFDKVTVVAHSKHIAEIKKSLPANVALWEVQDGDIKVLKRGRSVKVFNQAALLSLMNLIDLLRVCRKLGLKLKEKNRAVVEHYLKDVSPTVLRDEVITSLHSRYRDVTVSFWAEVDKSGINTGQLSFLSRFKPQRERIKVAKQRTREFWKRWNIQASCIDDPLLHQLYKETNQPLFGHVPENIKPLISRA